MTYLLIACKVREHIGSNSILMYRRCVLPGVASTLTVALVTDVPACAVRRLATSLAFEMRFRESVQCS
jgi:hypothetical protein